MWLKKNHCGTKTCCALGCDKPRWVYGRCQFHFSRLDPTSESRLKAMTRAEREQEFKEMTLRPERPKWEYAGREAELLSEQENQDHE
jgi:hypothetical protein